MSQLLDAVDAVGDLIAEHVEYKPNTVTPATPTGAELEARLRDLQGVVFAIDHGSASGVALDLLGRPTTVSALRATAFELLAALRNATGRTRFAEALDAPDRTSLAEALDAVSAALDH